MITKLMTRHLQQMMQNILQTLRSSFVIANFSLVVASVSWNG